MANWKKIGILTGLAGLSGYIGRIYFSGKKLEFVPTINVHQLSLQGVTLRVDVLVKNPSSVNLSIQQPYVKLLYEGNVIGSSQPSRVVKEFRKNDVKAFDSIYIQLPFQSLLSNTGKLISALSENKTIVMEARVNTSIQLFGFMIPLPEQTLPIQLKKGTNGR
jgi:hypothetical protein